jgi:hypothetical protein
MRLKAIFVVAIISVSSNTAPLNFVIACYTTVSTYFNILSRGKQFTFGAQTDRPVVCCSCLVRQFIPHFPYPGFRVSSMLPNNLKSFSAVCPRRDIFAQISGIEFQCWNIIRPNCLVSMNRGVPHLGYGTHFSLLCSSTGSFFYFYIKKEHANRGDELFSTEHRSAAVYAVSTRKDTAWTQCEPYVRTDGQSATLSWNKAPIWGLRPESYNCQTVSGLLMYGALPDGRTGLLLRLLLVSSAQSFSACLPNGFTNQVVVLLRACDTWQRLFLWLSSSCRE